MMDKLSKDDYPKLSELVGDVELTLRNCRTFNQGVECAAHHSCRPTHTFDTENFYNTQ